MAFPDKTWWYGEDNWEDLGRIAPRHFIKNGREYTSTPLHEFCGRRLSIGRENGELFKYCPRCMTKINNYD